MHERANPVHTDATPPASNASSSPLEGHATLARWMDRAHPDHPALGPVVSPNDDAAVSAIRAQALDAYEALLSTVETGDPTRWKAKRERDFPALKSHRQLLDFRAELLIANALHHRDVDYRLGDTKTSNPDFLLPGHDLGLEVTAKAPPGIDALHDRLEDALRDTPRIGVQLTFNLYPSRLTPDVVQEFTDQVAAAVKRVHQGEAMATVRQEVDDPKNVGVISIEATIKPLTAQSDQGPVSWEVRFGLLESPLSSAEHAVFEIGGDEAKARQARSVAGGVILAVDLSRYGGAWIRPQSMWPGYLARRFTPDFPFVAVVVFRQDLRFAHLVDPAVGISGHAAPRTRQRVEELCDILAWPHATGPVGVARSADQDI